MLITIIGGGIIAMVMHIIPGPVARVHNGRLPSVPPRGATTPAGANHGD
jgi:hypothetical protein